MYIYDRKDSNGKSLPNQSVVSRPVGSYSYSWAHEGLGQSPTNDLSKQLKVLSFFPHVAVANGKYVPLTPNVMDPGFYDGSRNYKVAPRLQDCLKNVMKTANFRPIKVALVDLTKDLMQPEFAGSFDHKQQVFVASVAKIAAMLAAFQLRQDLRDRRRAQAVNKSLADLFTSVRNDWVSTQKDPAKLVLGGRVKLKEPRSPQLENNFGPRWPFAIEFKSTVESQAVLQPLVDDLLLKKEYKALEDAKKERGPAAKKKREEAKKALEMARRTKQPAAKKRFDALGFWERLGITVAGASDYAASTIVRDVGFTYIASTLLQSGIYDPSRGGGLWLGADYRGIVWKGALAGGDTISATAGSLAAFMTFLAQKRLVSPEASLEMQFLMQKFPEAPFPGFGSWFGQGLSWRGVKRLLSKVGLARGGADECAYIERWVDDDKGGQMLLRYVAVGLRAKDGSDLEQLIVELDKCILANNGLSPGHGGHVTPHQ